MIKEDNLILSIAGHDPTGGAGIQVDAQIANFHGKHCLSILTCETVQNLNSFEKLIPQEEKYIQKAYKSLLKNFSMKYFKIGLVPNIEIANKLSDLITLNKPKIVVIDPILKSGTGGEIFLKKDFDSLLRKLYAKATLLTPNVYELKTLTNKKSISDGILFLNERGIENVYVSGEIKKGKIRNYLYSKGKLVNIDEVPKLKIKIHGSGCALSTSILCFLINKQSLKDACSKSQYVMKDLVKKSRNHIHQNILKI
jgi:hydroxymethylpyrimidine/phosphomethylpyrimidine kinase